MNEKEQAVLLANTVLDRITADPDDDLAILARQLLRSREALERIRDHDTDTDLAAKHMAAIAHAALSH